LILLAKSVLELDLGTFWVPASQPRPAYWISKLFAESHRPPRASIRSADSANPSSQDRTPHRAIELARRLPQPPTARAV